MTAKITPGLRVIMAALAAALVTLGLPGGTAVAAPSAPAGAGGAGVLPVLECSALAGADFSHVPHAPSQVTSAMPMISMGHSYCDVRGTIRPRTHFQIKLPTTRWHGQYLQEGCSTLCGAIELLDRPLVGFNCPPVKRGELVLAADDGGHTSADRTDGRWGRDDPELRRVFGLTSEHSLSRLAKAVIARYYGRPPTHSYFEGCSTGGRQALNLAQRYPADFDGIIAGSPAGNVAPLALLNAWDVRHNTDAGGHQVLTADKLPALHAAVLRQCAGSNGLIGDPRQCAFQPATIQCPAGTDTPSCLTPTQVSAVRAFYRGPTDSAGRSLYNGGQPYGSELGWQGSFIASAADSGAPADTSAGRVALNYLKYLAYSHNPPDTFTLADVRFTDGEFKRLNRLGDAIYNANNPDLTAFRDHGGKLILYHGWADPTIPPWSTIDYAAAMERTMGGFVASQQFSRLYLIPGGYLCLLGPDINNPVELAAPEFLTPLIAWVERGIAPGAIPAPIVTFSGQLVVDQTVLPSDALAPVKPAPGSLNGHYRYIGHYRTRRR
jgi:pimeloyl-ACP methyl ester carboxylesterase